MLLVNRGWLFPASWDKFDKDITLSDCNIREPENYGIILYVFNKTGVILKW